MPAVQNQNLADTYCQQLAAVMTGLLARADFPADRLTIQQFLDIAGPIALAATRRLATTVTDLSVVTPPVTDFNGGYSLSSIMFTATQQAPPSPTYVPPNVVQTPGGNYVPPPEFD